jgi:Domain of unknown function (DUF5667)
MPDARLTRLADHLRPGRSDETDEAILRRLEMLPVGPEPDPEFRARLRAELIGLAPQLMAEPEDDSDSATALVPVLSWRKRHPTLQKSLLVVTAAAAVLVVLLGMSVWLSGNALPGSALYGLKRASENAQLSVTHGDIAKGKKYLQLATNRLSEVKDLTNNGKNLSPHTQDLVASTLETGDSQTQDGTALITHTAVADQDKSVLAPLDVFSRTQLDGLNSILKSLPKTGKAHRATTHSIAIVHTVQLRSTQLKASIGCACLTTANSDQYGPRPCGSCPPGKKSDAPPSGHSKRGTTVPASNVPSTPGGGGGSTDGTGGGTAGGTDTGAGTTLPAPIPDPVPPTLPTQSTDPTTAPTDSCGDSDCSSTDTGGSSSDSSDDTGGNDQTPGGCTDNCPTGDPTPTDTLTLTLLYQGARLF